MYLLFCYFIKFLFVLIIRVKQKKAYWVKMTMVENADTPVEMPVAGMVLNLTPALQMQSQEIV